MNLSLLQQEIDSDPLVRGYQDMTDQQIADSLNVVNRQKMRDFMRGSDIMEAIVDSEWGNLSQNHQLLVLSLAGVDQLDPRGFVAKMLVRIFGMQSETVAALDEARKHTVSRARELGLEFVNGGDVKQVRRV